MTFPSGIPALVDYVHSQNLKFGLYSGRLNSSFEFVHCFHLLDRGNLTCQRRPGSLGYETKDAFTYANWSVDYLKLDSCNLDSTPPHIEYSKMRDALNATGRPIFFSLCGRNKPKVYHHFLYFFVKGGVDVKDLWPPSVGNSWRTTTDLQDYWLSMINNIDLVSFPVRQIIYRSILLE